MKKIVSYILAGALSLGMVSCFEDTRNDYLDGFDAFVYFRNGGEQDLTLYKTGDPKIYKIPICKAGNNPSATLSARVAAMTETQLRIYNAENGTAFELVPDDLYAFNEQTELEFGSSDMNKVLSVTINTDEIYTLSTGNPDKTYVLPLVVYANEQVGQNGAELILRPDVKMPYLTPRDAGLVSRKITEDVTAATYSVDIPIDNQWDLSAQVVVDEQALIDYNAENETDYELLPASQYTLSNDGKITFAQGATKADLNFSVTIDKGTEYVLPLTLKDPTKFEVAEESKTVFYYFYRNIDTHAVALTADMITANAPAEEGSLDMLVDGKIADGNLYHSPYWGYSYEGEETYGHYLDFALPEALQYVQITYTTRTNNNNGVPYLVDLYTSTDGTTWEKLATLDASTDAEMPMTAGGAYESKVFNAKKQIKHLRFAVLRSGPVGGNDLTDPTNGPYYALSEFGINGAAE